MDFGYLWCGAAWCEIQLTLFQLGSFFIRTVEARVLVFMEEIEEPARRVHSARLLPTK